MDDKSAYPTTYPHYPPAQPPNYPVAGFQVPPNYNQNTGLSGPGTVIVTQVTTAQFGPSPSQTVCPSCHATILTNVKYEPNTKTHIMALILCLFVCWPCVCLPYCMDSCQSGNHYCPNCNAYLGVNNRDSC